jgi:hypothetical protein
MIAQRSSQPGDVFAKLTVLVVEDAGLAQSLQGSLAPVTVMHAPLRPLVRYGAPDGRCALARLHVVRVFSESNKQRSEPVTVRKRSLGWQLSTLPYAGMERSILCKGLEQKVDQDAHPWRQPGAVWIEDGHGGLRRHLRFGKHFHQLATGKRSVGVMTSHPRDPHIEQRSVQNHFRIADHESRIEAHSRGAVGFRAALLLAARVASEGPRVHLSVEKLHPQQIVLGKIAWDLRNSASLQVARRGDQHRGDVTDLARNHAIGWLTAATDTDVETLADEIHRLVVEHQVDLHICIHAVQVLGLRQLQRLRARSDRRGPAQRTLVLLR